MEDISNMIRPELLVLIPVLYFVRLGLQKLLPGAERIAPLLAGLGGVVLAVLYLLATTPAGSLQEIAMLSFAGITQGILCAGCSALVGHLLQRNRKDGEEK